MDEKKALDRAKELARLFRPLGPGEVIRILSVGGADPFVFRSVRARAEPVECHHPDCVVRSVLES